MYLIKIFHKIVYTMISHIKYFLCREFAMRKIQMNLQQKELEPAVSLLRAARYVLLL